MTVRRVDLAGPAGPDADPAAVPRLVSSKAGWYTMAGSYGELPVQSYGQGILYAAPLLVYSTMTFDRVGIRLSSDGSSSHKFRIGVYDDTGEGYPRNLLAGGEVSNATGPTGLPAGEFGINLTLARGIWWLAYICTLRPDNNFPYTYSYDSSLRWPFMPNRALALKISGQSGLTSPFPSGGFDETFGQSAPRVLVRST